MMNFNIKNIRRTFVKRSIGIDIGQDSFCAVQMLNQGDSYRIEKSFATPIRRKDDDLTRLIRDLFRSHGFSRWAFVAVSIDAEKVSYRHCKTDNPVTASLFPIDEKQLLVQMLPSNQQGHCVKMATSTQAINQRLETLKKASMSADLIASPLLSVLRAACFDQPGLKEQKRVFAYVGQNCLSIAILENGTVQMVRQTPPAAQNSQANDLTAQLICQSGQTWQRLYNQPMPDDTPIYVINDGDGLCEAGANLKMSRFESFAGMAEHKCTFLSSALALSALDGEPGQMDWLQTCRLNDSSKLNMKKEAKKIAALAAAAAILAAATMFAHKGRLENINSQLDRQTAQIFESALPNEPMVRPREQLSHGLEQLRATARALNLDNAGPGEFVDMLYHVIDAMPARQQIQITDMSFSADRLTLQCRAQTFSGVNQWKQAIARQLQAARVETSDLARQESTGQISFTMSIDQSEPNRYAANP